MQLRVPRLPLRAAAHVHLSVAENRQRRKLPDVVGELTVSQGLTQQQALARCAVDPPRDLFISRSDVGNARAKVGGPLAYLADAATAANPVCVGDCRNAVGPTRARAHMSPCLKVDAAGWRSSPDEWKSCQLLHERQAEDFIVFQQQEMCRAANGSGELGQLRPFMAGIMTRGQKSLAAHYGHGGSLSL